MVSVIPDPNVSVRVYEWLSEWCHQVYKWDTDCLYGFNSGKTSLHFIFILLINQCIFYTVCLLSVVISDTNTHIQDCFSTGGDKWQNQICPLATFCYMKVKLPKRLFQNKKTYEAETWQDSASQGYFQLTVAQGSNEKSLLVPPIRRRKRDKSLKKPLIIRANWS